LDLVSHLEHRVDPARVQLRLVLPLRRRQELAHRQLQLMHPLLWGPSAARSTTSPCKAQNTALVKLVEIYHEQVGNPSQERRPMLQTIFAATAPRSTAYPNSENLIHDAHQ
jgi:hypothetical protein